MSIRTLIITTIAAGACAPMCVLATDRPDGESTTAAPKAASMQCDLVTGSRIRPDPARNCEAPAPYRAYATEDIRRTGKIDLADALRRIDVIFH